MAKQAKGRPPIKQTIRDRAIRDFQNGMKREDVVRKYKISKSSLYGWIAERAKEA